MEKIKINYAEPVWGMQMGVKTLNVHDRSQCEGDFCCLHNPSNHPLKDAPMNWRADKRQMERVCPDCGCAHPDLDDLAYNMRIDPEAGWMGVHGCCGACRGKCSSLKNDEVFGA